MLVHTSGALKAQPCCLQSPLDAAHIYCSTVHLHNICEKIRRVPQQGVQSLVSLHACMGSQQRHSSALWLDQWQRGDLCSHDRHHRVASAMLWWGDVMLCTAVKGRGRHYSCWYRRVMFHYKLWIQLPYFCFFLPRICIDLLSDLTNLCRRNKVLK